MKHQDLIQLEILLGILEIMARLRSITADQAIRLFSTYYPGAVERALRQAVADKNVARAEASVPAPTDAKIRKGRTDERPVTIYYITKKGKALLRRHLRNQGRKVRFLKTSEPVGVHLQRLYHDLIIVEALIWWQDNYRVLRFWIEDELRSTGENKADLRVATILRDGSIGLSDCEIVVQNSLEDIKKKRKDMWWFTPSLTQKDIIMALQKSKGVIRIGLGGVVQKVVTPSGALTNAEAEAIAVLKRMNGALTAGAVAACLQKRREKISSLLKGLVDSGHLVASSVRMRDGKEAGSPYKVYAIDDCFIDSTADREFAVRLSKMIEYLSRFDHTVSDIDPKSETAYIKGDRINRRLKISDDIGVYA